MKSLFAVRRATPWPASNARIGNPLRGDDGVGSLLAGKVGGRSVH